MKVVVTGAAGLTAGEVVRQLVEHGHAVVGLVHRPEQRGALPRGTDATVGDTRNADVMRQALRGIDALVHVSGILQGEALASVPELRSVASVVVVSSAGIYSRHRFSADAYRRNEDAIRAVRPDVVLVRPTMIYGSPRDRNVHYVINAARRFHVLPLFGEGSARLQPIHFADLAAAVVALVGRTVPSPIDAGGGTTVSLREAGDLIFAALGLPPRYVRIPLPAAEAVARTLGRRRLLERLQRMTEDRTVNNAALVAVTEVRPRDFAAGIRDQVAASTL